jgi:16S rRNA (guanine1516-N2)-methyltransferase
MNDRYYPVVVYLESEAQVETAEHLAKLLGVPLVTKIEQPLFVLALKATGLELQLPDSTMKPIRVDFLNNETQQRLLKSHLRNELIARAVGMKSNYRPHVIDATAGLGGDAIILAHLGCQVDMCERSPIICALLKDGLARAGSEFSRNLVLHCEDAKVFLRQANVTADVVYLDPMFPDRVKSALVKKEMRILKQLVGGDEDASELFAIAMDTAQKRVVVKRPRHAPTLTNLKPSVTYQGRACRFDVYIKN